LLRRRAPRDDKRFILFKGVSGKDLSVMLVTSPQRPAEYVRIIKFGPQESAAHEEIGQTTRSNSTGSLVRLGVKKSPPRIPDEQNN
jgi:hypothetical protein